MGLMLTIIILCAVLGVPATLAWWKVADRWADAEHKRFPVKRASSKPVAGPAPTVVDLDTESKV